MASNVGSPNLDETRLAVWRGFLEAHATVTRKLERDLMAQVGIPLTWYDVLIQLHESPEGRLRMQALAESVVLSRSGLTRLIDRMEKAGLVRREPAQEDRRGHYAVITEGGRQTYLRARPLHHRGIYEHFTRHLDDADVQALQTALAKVSKANQALPDTGRS